MIELIIKSLLPILWGVYENRAWLEHGENWIVGHFKTYHLLMFLLFGSIASIGLPHTTECIWQWIWWMTYTVLILDVVWWVIRWYDITVRRVNTYDGGYGKAWHSITDWDNLGGLPLLFGTYVWWYVAAAILVIVPLGTTL